MKVIINVITIFITLLILNACSNKDYIKLKESKSITVINDVSLMKSPSLNGKIKRFIPKGQEIRLLGYIEYKVNEETHIKYHIQNVHNVKGWIAEKYINYNAKSFNENLIVKLSGEIELYDSPFIHSTSKKQLNNGDYLILKAEYKREFFWYQVKSFDHFYGWVKKEILDNRSAQLINYSLIDNGQYIKSFPKVDNNITVVIDSKNNKNIIYDFINNSFKIKIADEKEYISTLEFLPNNDNKEMFELETGLGVFSNLIIDGEFVYYYKYLTKNSSVYCTLLCRDRNTGDLLWERVIGNSKQYRSNPGMLYKKDSTLNFIYADYGNNELYYMKFSLEGEELSRKRLIKSLGDKTSFTLHGNKLFFIINNKSVFSYDLIKDDIELVCYTNERILQYLIQNKSIYIKQKNGILKKTI